MEISEARATKKKLEEREQLSIIFIDTQSVHDSG